MGLAKLGSQTMRMAASNSAIWVSAGIQPARQMGLGNSTIIAIEKTEQHLRNILLILIAYYTHDAKIDGYPFTFIGYKDIAGVHIGVKEIILKRLLEKSFYPVCSQLF